MDKHFLATCIKYYVQQVHVYLKSSSWETRIAAGQAIEAIAQNVPLWNPVAVQNIKGKVCQSTPWLSKTKLKQWPITVKGNVSLIQLELKVKTCWHPWLKWNLSKEIGFFSLSFASTWLGE